MGARGLGALAGMTLAVMLAGCSSASQRWVVESSIPADPAAPVSCHDLTKRVVDAVQRYVDGFHDAHTRRLSAAAAGRRANVETTTAELQQRAAGLDCSADDLETLARAELGRLEGATPVQDAIAATFQADPLGTVGPAQAATVSVTVDGAAELVGAVSTAGDGSVITLLPGSYVLDRTLVALRPVTIIGAGVDATRIISTAAGAALVAATSGNVRIAGLTLDHVGTAPASTVIVAGGGYDLQRVRLTGGITDDAEAGGFGLIVQPAANPVTGGNLTQTLRDVVLAGNAGGGLVVSGSAAPNIRGIAVDGESGCGLCWVQNAGGNVVGATVNGVDEGLSTADAAAPHVTDLTVDGTRTGLALGGTGDARVRHAVLTGNDIGVDVSGSGRPVLTETEVVASPDIGIRVAGRSEARLNRSTVIGPTAVALTVGDDAASRIRGAALTTTGAVGAAWTDRAAGTARGLTVRGARVGIRLSGDSAAELDDVVAAEAPTASLVAQDRAGGRVIALTCAPGPGAASLSRGSRVDLADSQDCAVVDALEGRLR